MGQENKRNVKGAKILKYRESRVICKENTWGFGVEKICLKRTKLFSKIDSKFGKSCIKGSKIFVTPFFFCSVVVGILKGGQNFLN